MLQIKFRAWDKAIKKMYPEVKAVTFTLLNSFSGIEVVVDEPLGQTVKLPGDMVELLQCTGVKDRNGKEIYQGDVVVYYDDRPSEIVYERGQFTFAYEAQTMPNMRNAIGYYESHRMEVVGNIYENPELLK